MVTWPGNIEAVTLFVSDLDASKRFYHEVFGLSVHFEDAHSAVFKFDGTLINLLKTSAAGDLIAPLEVGSPDASPRMQFTLQVDDVDDRHSELARRGVAFVNGPMDRPWGVRTACFADPDGHLWEIASGIDS